jgi:hypothetical protein
MDRGMLRVGDADRDRAVTRLRKACAEGRLTLDEAPRCMDVAFRATAAFSPSGGIDMTDNTGKERR